MILTRNPSVT